MDDRDAAERFLFLVESAILAFLSFAERRQRVRVLAVWKVPRRRLGGRLPPRLLLQHHEAHRTGQVVLRVPPLRGLVSESILIRWDSTRKCSPHSFPPFFGWGNGFSIRKLNLFEEGALFRSKYENMYPLPSKLIHFFRW